MKRVRIKIRVVGKVQGVCFRAFIRGKARELGIGGYVRNLEDGRVEAVFEGQKEKVGTMAAFCRQGSPASKVSAVEAIREEPEGLREFEVRM